MLLDDFERCQMIMTYNLAVLKDEFHTDLNSPGFVVLEMVTEVAAAESEEESCNVSSR